jgi:hypothetical protein
MRACAHLVLLLLGLSLHAAPAFAQGESPEKKVKSAEGLLRSGNAAEAEKILLSISEPGAKALSLLGQVQVKLKKYEEALKTYERYVTVETVASKRAAGEQLLSELKVLSQTRFKILTTPPGATVYIDSKADGAVGKTPLSHMVTPGRHRIILELPGYETIKVNVSAVEQQELELPFTMLPTGCELTITSEPAGAKIVIDGKGAGTTPVTRRVPAGIYRIEAVIKEGEPPVARQAVCDEKDQKPIPINLSAPPGSEAPPVPAADGGAPDGGAPDAAPARAPGAPKEAPRDAAKDAPKAPPPGQK